MCGQQVPLQQVSLLCVCGVYLGGLLVYEMCKGLGDRVLLLLLYPLYPLSPPVSPPVSRPPHTQPRTSRLPCGMWHTHICPCPPYPPPFVNLSCAVVPGTAVMTWTISTQRRAGSSSVKRGMHWQQACA